MRFLLLVAAANAHHHNFPRQLSSSPENERPYKPIMLERSGGFAIGGQVIHSPDYPSQTLSCDHGYFEYFVPWMPRKTSLVMWHSSSTQVFQNRWDGGEGFKDMFLRRDYPVYLWDGPRVGRANWACEGRTYRPDYRDNGNFVAWNFGPSYPNWWNDTQFPSNDTEAWNQATRGRYEEIDTVENVELHSTTAALAADSGRVGDSIVYLTNSAAGLRALMTAAKAQKNNIKGIVMYEIIGSVFPDNANVTDGNNGFGPFVIPAADFKKLASLERIQFIWGSHHDDGDYYVNMSHRMAELINRDGGHAEVVLLSREWGLAGSTHSAFADMDNDKVAAVMDDFLERSHLDGYA